MELWCNSCEEWRLEAEFNFVARYKPHINFRDPNDPRRWKKFCKKCNTPWRGRFGPVHPLYRSLVEAQGGEFCAICLFTPVQKTRLDVDYDQETGIIRGLLCGKCYATRYNLMRGFFDLSPRSRSLPQWPNTARGRELQRKRVLRSVGRNPGGKHAQLLFKLVQYLKNPPAEYLNLTFDENFHARAFRDSPPQL